MLTVNHISDQMNLADTYKTCHLTPAEYTFYSSAYGKFSRIDNMIGHKTNLSKLKKIEIISIIFYFFFSIEV